MKIGIDVGGTNLVAGLVSDAGEILYRASIHTLPAEGYEAVLSRLVKIIEDVMAQGEAEGLAVRDLPIGLGVPGVVSRDARVAINCPNIFWHNIPLAEDLEKVFTGPVHLANDADVAAIAENRFGSTKGYEDSVMFTLGTGVGGGFIIGGRLITGSHGLAAEVGHVVVDQGNYQCNCGKWGCLETYASASGLIKNTIIGIEAGRDSSVIERVGGDLSRINAKIVVDAAKAGDPLALEVFTSAIEHLAQAMANLTILIDPAIYTIGGGVAKAGSFLLDNLRESYYQKLTYPEVAHPIVTLATLENDAGVVGAAYISDYVG